MSQAPRPIYRAPMRSRAREARPGAGAEFALRRGVVGIGEAVDGSYRLGRISGSWRYDDSPEAREVGIHHVRPALWSARRFSDREVPAGVAHAFARGGRNLQRTHDREAERLTAEHWRRYRPTDVFDREDQSAAARPE